MMIRTIETYNDEMANSHADSANDECGLATPAINVHDGGYGGDKHDNSHNTGCKKGDRVAGKTELAEYNGGVVEHSVDTSPSTQYQSARIHL